jgi:hypothetical protein
MSHVGSDAWKLTLFTVRLWSINTCSCFDRDKRFRFHTTTAPFVAAVAKRWSVDRSAMTVTKAWTETYSNIFVIILLFRLPITEHVTSPNGNTIPTYHMHIICCNLIYLLDFY